MKLNDEYTYDITAYVSLQDADLFSNTVNGKRLGHFVGRDKEKHTVFHSNDHELSSDDVENLLKMLVNNQINAQLSIEAIYEDKYYHDEVYKSFGKYTSKISKGQLKGYST